MTTYHYSPPPSARRPVTSDSWHVEPAFLYRGFAAGIAVGTVVGVLTAALLPHVLGAIFLPCLTGGISGGLASSLVLRVTRRQVAVAP
jgi:hypothetical protein